MLLQHLLGPHHQGSPASGGILLCYDFIFELGLLLCIHCGKREEFHGRGKAGSLLHRWQYTLNPTFEYRIVAERFWCSMPQKRSIWKAKKKRPYRQRTSVCTGGRDCWLHQIIYNLWKPWYGVERGTLGSGQNGHVSPGNKIFSASQRRERWHEPHRKSCRPPEPASVRLSPGKLCIITQHSPEFTPGPGSHHGFKQNGL